MASIVRPDRWHPSETEIDEIIEVAVDDLVAARTVETRERDGHRWEMPVFPVDRHRVWGFTAFVLARLLDLAQPVLLGDPPGRTLRIASDRAERVVAELHDADPRFHWTGIYWRRGERLELGPYRGAHPAGHETIEIPDGVCGAVAARGATEVVPDVRARPGHIACELSTRSEVVAPIFLEGQLVGVLDVDSDEIDAFDDRRVALIEAAAARIAAIAEPPASD